MDPKKLFADQRLGGMCVYCGGVPETRDHVPSKVLLDDPLPPELPVVPACRICNNGFSLDEQYLACLVECTVTGSADPSCVRREKVRNILATKPALRTRIEASRRIDERGQTVWVPEMSRVQNIVLKLARGHAVYESSELQLTPPNSIAWTPISTLSAEQLRGFESPPEETIFPEIGSRAFMRGILVNPGALAPYSDWRVVQNGRYRYLVSHSGGLAVRMVLSEYLACEVIWG